VFRVRRALPEYRVLLGHRGLLAIQGYKGLLAILVYRVLKESKDRLALQALRACKVELVLRASLERREVKEL
jgi:hypothetical protein